MASQDSFLGTGTLTMMDADDAAAVHVTADLRGGQASSSNNWIVSIMDVTAGELRGSLLWEIREIDDVQYDQNPLTGEWEIDEDRSENPVQDILRGTLTLADVSVEDLGDGYLITGTYPEDATIEFISIEVGSDDLLVRNFTSVSRQTRGEFAGLVPQGDADIISIAQWEFGDFGIGLTPATEPIEGLPTAITRFEGGLFQLQIPTAWAELTPAEIADAELGVDRAWSTDEGLLLLVATDDLIELGFGSTTTDDYIDLVLEEVLVEEFIDESNLSVNVQGKEVGSIIGETSPDRNPFIRIIAVQEETIAFNATILATQAAFETNIAAIEFILNSLLIDD